MTFNRHFRMDNRRAIVFPNEASILIRVMLAFAPNQRVAKANARTAICQLSEHVSPDLCFAEASARDVRDESHMAPRCTEWRSLFPLNFQPSSWPHRGSPTVGRRKQFGASGIPTSAHALSHLSSILSMWTVPPVH